eukprot:351965-Chlamydomonas_euryale.AAC.12
MLLFMKVLQLEMEKLSLSKTVKSDRGASSRLQVLDEELSGAPWQQLKVQTQAHEPGSDLPGGGHWHCATVALTERVCAPQPSSWFYRGPVHWALPIYTCLPRYSHGM